MARRFLIYGLVDPRTHELRYVGKSCKGMIRPKERHHAHCRNWEENLLRQNLKPTIVVFHETDCADFLKEAEIFWIKYFRSIGCRLTNMTDGGEGSLGSKPSLETRQKMSLARIGKPSGMKGKTVPEERRERISNSLSALKLKRVFTAEHRAKLAAAKIGKPGNNRKKEVTHGT